jgi:transcription-repair coupling factor (superfamily II helicase)
MDEFIKLQVGADCDIRRLFARLFDFNYCQDTEVTRQGEFAQRGNVIDIFPFNFSQPVRITLEFDRIASMRGFLLGSGSALYSYQELTILPVHEFFERRPSRHAYIDTDPLQHFMQIKKGDYVVHVNYGIGRYRGTRSLSVKGKKKKHIMIEYRDDELLYVDIDNRTFIQRYIGMEGRAPKLNKLRTGDWQRIKERTRRAVKVIARDLLKVQAKRNALLGFRYSPDSEWQTQFENEFEYTETPDQIKATRDVKNDMHSKRPMDRLICGDVGYGKTEVAMRAAFKAIMDNKQVAMLVPTTILAEQHYLTFKRRVGSFPVSVAALSRFKTRSEQAEIVKQLKDGSCDIVIGTHRLLSKDIGFKDLGLVIIDEEQRFGVLHKEKLKHYRELVDVLTLTATPIPRTLYMSLMGIRDISMITTPPKTRLPIKTEVLEYDLARIKEAITREHERGGQIYFVHNRVQSIEKQADRLRGLLPDVRFALAHGQMPPHELEVIMQDFFSAKIDCLVCTNIIESGLDVPNVNTIIINRADTFGLSDLYQLRGRVGRFTKQRKAYAYFLIPKNFVMTQDAQKRLDAIEQYTALGSGFKIAMEDLELRGAGNLLGSEQSGFIAQVGFDLYCRLLQEAIDEAQTE